MLIKPEKPIDFTFEKGEKVNADEFFPELFAEHGITDLAQLAVDLSQYEVTDRGINIVPALDFEMMMIQHMKGLWLRPDNNGMVELEAGWGGQETVKDGERALLDG